MAPDGAGGATELIRSMHRRGLAAGPFYTQPSNLLSLSYAVCCLSSQNPTELVPIHSSKMVELN